MRDLIRDYLQEVLHQAAPMDGGELNSTWALQKVDPNRLAVALCMSDGHVHGEGDCDYDFSIQSMSKPFVYALALSEHGIETVTDNYVGVEPSGDPFNRISVGRDGLPSNPMINMGAITTYGIIGGQGCDPDERFRRVQTFLSECAARELEVDEEVYQAELDSAWRNLALGHMVRSLEVFTDDPTQVVHGYSRQCSLKVTVKDLAVMGATLALRGRNPVTGEQVMSRDVARQVLAVMSTCGMYDAAGDWMADVGIPAKSGVSGGIYGSLPGQLGVAAFSPRLDRTGTSLRALEVFRRLSADMGMHMMDVSLHMAEVLKATREEPQPGEDEYQMLVTGPLIFTTMERLLHELEDVPEDAERLTLDLTRVTGANDVGRAMLRQVIREVISQGTQVDIVRPELDVHLDLDTTIEGVGIRRRA